MCVCEHMRAHVCVWCVCTDHVMFKRGAQGTHTGCWDKRLTIHRKKTELLPHTTIHLETILD